MQTQLELAASLKLLEQSNVAEVMKQSEEVAGMINGLLAALDV